MPQRITETELILPSLYLMSLNNGVITTSELIKKLRVIMKPNRNRSQPLEIQVLIDNINANGLFVINRL
jgi:hypothetical protein